jgi:hypothetical protein
LRPRRCSEMSRRLDIDENRRTVLAGRPKTLRSDASGTEARALVTSDYARERVDFATVAKPRPDLDSARQPRAMKGRQCCFARVRRLWLDDEDVLRVCGSESQAEKGLRFRVARRSSLSLCRHYATVRYPRNSERNVTTARNLAVGKRRNDGIGAVGSMSARSMARAGSLAPTCVRSGPGPLLPA